MCFVSSVFNMGEKKEERMKKKASLGVSVRLHAPVHPAASVLMCAPGEAAVQGWDFRLAVGSLRVLMGIEEIPQILQSEQSQLFQSVLTREMLQALQDLHDTMFGTLHHVQFSYI